MVRRSILLGAVIGCLWLGAGILAWWRQVDQLLAGPSFTGTPSVLRREASIAGSGFMRISAVNAPGPHQETERLVPSPSRNLASFSPPTTPAAGNTQAATAIADQFLNEHGSAWQIRPYHQLKPTASEGPNGITVNYSVYQDGYPILGMNFKVVVSRELQVLSSTANYRPVQPADLSQPVMSPDEVLESTVDRLDLGDAKNVGTVLYLNGNSDIPELAYTVPTKEQAGPNRSLQAIYRASDGQLLNRSFATSE